MKTQIILFVLMALTAQAQDFKRDRPRAGFPGLELTQKQMECLEKLRPKDGQMPSREKVEADFKSCGVELPARPDGPPPQRREQSQSGGAVQ